MISGTPVERVSSRDATIIYFVGTIIPIIMHLLISHKITQTFFSY